MRTLSLIPSATEIVYLLGREEQLVGRSHDSDFPPEVEDKPVVSTVEIGDQLTSKEIDKSVKESAHSGRSLFHLDQAKIRELDPDLILTQELCEVCAPSFTEVRKSARILEGGVDIVSLEPETLEDVLESIELVAEYLGVEKRGREEVHKLREKIEKIRDETEGLPEKSVAVIEWLDPLMASGHWVPEMVEMAGGNPLFSEKGEKSKPVNWQPILDQDPDKLIIAPCGFDIERIKEEMHLLTEKEGWGDLQAVKNEDVYLLDSDAYLTRSGPRLIEGIELMAKALHPEAIEYPGNMNGKIELWNY